MSDNFDIEERDAPDFTDQVLARTLSRYVPGAMPAPRIGGPVPPPEHDFATQVAQHKDKITKILKDDQPSDDSVTRAILRAGGGAQTYGEALNTLKASERAAAEGVMRHLSNERRAEQRDRALGVQEQRLTLETLGRLEKSGNKAVAERAGAIAKAVEMFAGSDPENRAKLFAEMESDPENVTAENAMQIAARARDRANLTPTHRDTAPKTRTRIDGNEYVVEERDSQAEGGWRELSRGNRFSDRGNVPSLAQQRRNEEILSARRILRTKGITHDELNRRGKQFDDLGRPNPDHDPSLRSASRLAGQRLTGVEDPDHDSILDIIHGTSTATAPATGASSSPTPTPQSQGGGELPLPLNASGAPDPSKLQAGKIYIATIGGKPTRVLWNGRTFDTLD